MYWNEKYFRKRNISLRTTRMHRFETPLRRLSKMSSHLKAVDYWLSIYPFMRPKSVSKSPLLHSWSRRILGVYLLSPLVTLLQRSDQCYNIWRFFLITAPSWALLSVHVTSLVFQCTELAYVECSNTPFIITFFRCNQCMDWISLRFNVWLSGHYHSHQLHS